MMTAYFRLAALWLMLFAASPLSWAATLPKDILLVFDNSGSMRHSDPHFLAKKAITHFVDGLPADTHFGVLIFDKAINLALPLTALDEAGKKAVGESLKAINYRGQLTDSPSAMERALYELRVNGRSDAQKIVVFMTDGIVDVGNSSESQDKATWLREELADEAAKNKIRIYAIAFTADADYQLIQSLATKTNGDYFRALKAEDLHDAFEHVSQDIAKLQPPPPPVPAPEAQTAPPKAAATTPEAPAPAAPATAPESAQTAPAAPTTSETQPTPAAPQEAQPPATTSSPSPVPAATEPATSATPAQAGAAGQTSAEQAAEEFEKATGISKEELDKLPEGQAIIVRPEHENKGMGLIIIGGGVVLVLLVIVGLFVFLKKRGGQKKAAPASAHGVEIPDEEEYVPRAFLRDLQGNTDLSEHELGTKPAMMGRVPGGDAEHVHYIVVNQPTIGRRHALIEYKDFSFWIVDQASVNGTFVNGQRVTGEQRLKHGDKIRLHKYDFEFVMPEVADAGKTVFAGASDKTVIADATLMQAAPVAAAAAAAAATPEPAAAPPMAQDEEDEEEGAFDVTGGFDAGVLPAAGIEAPAEESPEEESKEPGPEAGASTTSELGSVDDFLDSGSMEFGEMPGGDMIPGTEASMDEPLEEPSSAAPEQSENDDDVFQDKETVFLGSDSAPFAEESPEVPPEQPEGDDDAFQDKETVVLGSDSAPFAEKPPEAPPAQPEGDDDAFQDKATVVLGPDSVPFAEEPPEAPPVSEPEAEGEDMSLDSFISTTVLEASQLDNLSQPKEGGQSDEAQEPVKIGSEDPTIMPGNVGPAESAPSSPPPASETKGTEDEISLDDFLDDAAMMSRGGQDNSDKTVILSDDDDGDRTLMPSQVDKKPAKKEEEDTHMGDTTVFNADDVTLPPKGR